MNDFYMKTSGDALQALKLLHANKTIRLNELQDYENVFLKCSRVKGKKYYYSKKLGSSSFSYLGPGTNETVLCVKEHRYLRKLVSEVETEIQLLEHLHANHRLLDFASLNCSLPEVYRQDENLQTNISHTDAIYSDVARKWKEEKESLKALHVVKSPERLVMKAIDGTPMRSKSEVIIANLLIANGIPYVYELPHSVKDVTLYTDFTALSVADFKTEIKIEHQGMMSNSTYQQQFLFKLNSYLEGDIIPGRDIFFTFDDLHGGFDPSVIQDIIDTRLKPRQ